MPKLSVVIPVYNVEKYLPKCLDSVINQTLEDIEIILVNDGSKDSSGEICERYAESDGRIKYIYQENKGVAAARKKGMEYVTSDYVTFVDSDDWISLYFFEELYNNINNWDIVLSDCYRIEGDKTKVIKNDLPCGIYDTPERMKYVIDNMIYATAPEIKSIASVLGFMDGKLYKSEIARKTFEETDNTLFFYEDSEFLFKYILKCSSLNCTDICGYYYLDREGSCLNTVHPKYLLNLSNFYNSLLKTFKESEYSESLIKQLQYITICYITSIPKAMGFYPECVITRYISPYLNKIDGKRIALYGAGVVGKNYYFQMKKSKDGEPCLWVDKNYKRYNKELPVYPIEELKNADFDYILIAIENKDIAESIKQNLINMGFDEKIILSEEPIKLY